jgi:uncharacterized protein
VYVLNCTKASGEPVALRYDPHEGSLCNADGSSVLRDAQHRVGDFTGAIAVSPQQPGLKSRAPSVLKIQLGLNCNYSCSYCSQANQIPLTATSRTADVDAFLAGLDEWLVGEPEHIEFWGGEPLLYFAKLRKLVPELDRRFPSAELSMVTNGSLLTPEIVAFLAEYDILTTMSHDGPGQHLRGADPFADPLRAPLIKQLWAERKVRSRMSFNAVLTAINHDPAAIRRWFVEALGDPDVVVSLEGVVAVHEDERDTRGKWSKPQYDSLRRAISASFETGDALKMPALVGKAREFINSIQQRRPAAALGQKCSMDRPDHLAVDLLGNVLTCQNTGANGVHGIGTVRYMAAVRLDTSTHWSHRECCSHCPVVQLCQGSCMFLEGDAFAQSCDNEYHYNLGILEGVLRRAFNLRLQSIEGDVRRPHRSRIVPIVPAREQSLA